MPPGPAPLGRNKDELNDFPHLLNSHNQKMRE